MSCQVDVMSGKCVQEFEPEPYTLPGYYSTFTFWALRSSKMSLNFFFFSIFPIIYTLKRLLHIFPNFFEDFTKILHTKGLNGSQLTKFWKLTYSWYCKNFLKIDRRTYLQQKEKKRNILAYNIFM